MSTRATGMMRRHLWRLLPVVMVALGGPACSVVITNGGATPTATVVPTPVESTPTVAPIASTPTPDTRPVAPTVVGSGKREVGALWAAKRAEGWVGGTSPIQIAVEPNPGK